MSGRAPPPEVGDPVASIDTPALVIDLDAMERNLAAMAAFAARHGVRLRPHAKMHKCAAIARLQMAAGAVGVCVQKTSEAEALAAAGVADIYISNEVIDRQARPRRRAGAAHPAGDRRRFGRRRRAARRSDARAKARRSTCSSRSTSARAAAACRRRPPARWRSTSSRMRRPKAACASPACRPITARAQHLRGAAEREAASRHAAAQARAAQAGVTGAGIACPLVTGGGTGTFVFEASSGVWGELQVGSYLFMDRDYADNEPAEHAAVRARPVRQEAGDEPRRIACGGRCRPQVARHRFRAAAGLGDAISNSPAAATSTASCGCVPAARRPSLPQLGETVWLVPGHCDPTVNLHERYVALRGGLDAGVVEAVWAIEARGCIA